MQITTPADLVRMIVGRSMNEAFVRPAPPSDRVVFALQDAAVEGVGPVSFSVAAGETLGLVGLRGAGHHIIGRTIFAQLPPTAATVLLNGVPINPEAPARAMSIGIGFVSSRRSEESLIPPGRRLAFPRTYLIEMRPKGRPQ